MAKAVPLTRSMLERHHSFWSRPFSELGWTGVFGLFILVLGANAFRDLEFSWAVGSLFFQVLWAVIYLVAGLAMFYRFQLHWISDVVRWLPLMCLVIGIAVVSALWSVDPGLTLRRCVSLIGSTLLGIYIGYFISPRNLMSLLYWMFSGFMVANILVAILVPEFGTSTSHGEGAWKGITSNVNTLGASAAVSTVFFLAGVLRRRVTVLAGLVFIALSVLVLFMTGSVTAFLATATGATVVACFYLLPARHGVLVACLLLAGLALGVTILVLSVRAQTDIFMPAAPLSAVEGVVDPLGRDVTLTGRTHLWRDAAEMIEQQPWTGYGYGAVWGLGKYSHLPQFKATTGWAGDPHNGYLNLATNIGVPGAVIAVVFLVQMVIAAARALEKRRSPFALFALSYMFMFLVMNIAETSLFYRRLALWFLFVALAVGVVRLARDHRGSRRSPRTRKEGLKTRRHRTKSEAAARSGVERHSDWRARAFSL